MTLYPTYTCFDDALEFIDNLVIKIKDPEGFYLVHAICETEDNILYAHAWVESDLLEGGMCIFAGVLDGEKTYMAARKEEFYSTFHVKEHTEYDPYEALRENLRTGMFGPWEQKYKDLCSEERKILPGIGQINAFTIGPLKRKKGNE